METPDEMRSRIAQRALDALAKLEWTADYKRQLRDRCVARGEGAQALELTRELRDLAMQAAHHHAALALARA